MAEHVLAILVSRIEQRFDNSEAARVLVRVLEVDGPMSPGRVVAPCCDVGGSGLSPRRVHVATVGSAERQLLRPQVVPGGARKVISDGLARSTQQTGSEEQNRSSLYRLRD